MTDFEKWYCSTPSSLITFARRIQAAERERCAGILDANIKQCSPSGHLQEVLRSNAAAIREQSDE